MNNWNITCLLCDNFHSASQMSVEEHLVEEHSIQKAEIERGLIKAQIGANYYEWQRKMTQRLLDALLETQQNVNITFPLVLLAKELRTLHTNVCPLCLTYHSCKEFNRLEDIILTSEASEKESETTP